MEFIILTGCLILFCVVLALPNKTQKRVEPKHDLEDIPTGWRIFDYDFLDRSIIKTPEQPGDGMVCEYEQHEHQRKLDEGKDALSKWEWDISERKLRQYRQARVVKQHAQRAAFRKAGSMNKLAGN